MYKVYIYRKIISDGVNITELVKEITREKIKIIKHFKKIF